MADTQETKGKQKTGDKVVAESPKPAETAATTTVDAPAKEKKPRAPKGSANYRILDGVDVSKFSGQRLAVVKAMQKLAGAQGGDKFFSVDEIAKNVEGLQSKHPVADSTAWHLKQMKALKIVDEQITPASAAAATTDATKAA